MERLLARVRRNRGYLTAHEADELGYSVRDLSRAVDAGTWVRPRHGVYAPREEYEALTARDQHLVRLRSALAQYGTDYVATNISGTQVHGIGDDEQDLTLVHIAKIGGTTSRTSNGVKVHRGAVDPAAVTFVDGIPTVSAVLAVAESATTISDLDVATVLVSSWLAWLLSDARRRGMQDEFCESEEKGALAEVLAGFGHRAGTRTAKDALDIGDARCESPGEVRVLVLCWRFDIPRPKAQQIIDLPRGRRAEVDFLWSDVRHVLEFDGKVKYRDQPDGRRGEDALMAEKERERGLRDLAYGITRLVWADLLPANQAATAARIKRDLERSEQRLATSRSRSRRA